MRKSITSGLTAANSRLIMPPPLLPNTIVLSFPIALIIAAASRAYCAMVMLIIGSPVPRELLRLS